MLRRSFVFLFAVNVVSIVLGCTPPSVEPMIPVAVKTSGFPTEAEFDAFLQDEFRKSGIPGMAVAVVRDGRVIYAKGFGYSNLQNERKVSPETVFPIGSLTKQFTATMIMQLVQEKRLTLDSPVRSVMPGIPDQWGDFTVRQLLNHTSGLQDHTNPEILLSFPKGVRTEAQVLAAMNGQPPLAEPGKKYKYNNFEYLLLGLIVEHLDGGSYSESLSKRITDPLGMTQTYFRPEAAGIRDRATGYAKAGSGFDVSQGNPGALYYGSGDMESTVFDLAKWDAALYGDKILPQSALKQMWTSGSIGSGPTGYGFGWVVSVHRGSRLVWHNGGIYGYRSALFRLPAHGLTTIVLGNLEGREVSPIAQRLLDFADGAAPEKIVGIQDPDPKLTEFLRKYLEDALDLHPQLNATAPQLAALLTADALKSVAAQVKGPIDELTLVKATDGDTRLRIYHATSSGGEWRVTFQVTSDGLVAGMLVRPWGAG